MDNSRFIYFFFAISLFFCRVTVAQQWVVESAVPSEGDYSCFTSTRTGDIFLLNKSKYLLEEFDRNLKKNKQIGGIGWGNYEFDNPTDVWSSFLLEVFVVDFNNHRIQKYDRSLNYIQTFDENSIAKLEGKFFPAACAVNSVGDVYVVEGDGHRVLKINQRNQCEKEIGTYRDGLGALVQPIDITVSINDEICVLDKYSIKIFDQFGNYLKQIPLSAGNDWRRIQSFGEKVVITSSEAIQISDLLTSDTYRVQKTAVFGLDQTEKLQDAGLTDNTLLILTSGSMYRCILK